MVHAQECSWCCRRRFSAGASFIRKPASPTACATFIRPSASKLGRGAQRSTRTRPSPASALDRRRASAHGGRRSRVVAAGCALAFIFLYRVACAPDLLARTGAVRGESRVAGLPVRAAQSTFELHRRERAFREHVSCSLDVRPVGWDPLSSGRSRGLVGHVDRIRSGGILDQA